MNNINEAQPWKSFKVPFDLANSDLSLKKKEKMLQNWKDFHVQVCEAENEGMSSTKGSKNAVLLQEIDKVLLDLNSDISSQTHTKY